MMKLFQEREKTLLKKCNSFPKAKLMKTLCGTDCNYGNDKRKARIIRQSKKWEKIYKMNKKVLYLIIFIIILIAILIRIGYYINSKNSENTIIEQQNYNVANDTLKNDTNSEKEESNIMNNNNDTITLSINENSFDIGLEQNDTTDKLLELLPLEITMNDLNNNEKYYYLDEKLPTNPYSPKTIETGDVMLYGDDCLVIFYDTFKTPYSYTRIGKINNISNLRAILGNGKISIELR